MAINLTTTDYVSFGDLSAIDGATELSILFTVKTGGTISNDERMVSKWLGPIDFSFLAFCVGGDDVGFVVAESNSTVTWRGRQTTSNVLSANTTYRIGFRWRASDQAMEIWLDGVSQSLSTLVWDNSPASIAATAATVRVGDSVDANVMDGDYSDVAIYTSYVPDGHMYAHGKGFSPRLFTNIAKPVAYFRGLNTTDILDPYNATSMSNSGAADAGHPNTIYPRRKQVVVASAAAAASTIGFLRDNAGVGSMGGGPFSRSNAGLGVLA